MLICEEKNTAKVSNSLKRLVIYEREWVQTRNGGKGRRGNDASVSTTFCILTFRTQAFFHIHLPPQINN